MFYYLSLPEAEADPKRDPALWSLSATGRDRTTALAQSGAVDHIAQIVTSAETRAVETGAIIAGAIGCAMLIRPNLNQTDPRDPTQTCAKQRIVAESSEVLRGAPDNTLFIGHGEIGQLLLVQMNGHADQPPAAGQYFCWYGLTPKITDWAPMEAFA